VDCVLFGWSIGQYFGVARALAPVLTTIEPQPVGCSYFFASVVGDVSREDIENLLHPSNLMSLAVCLSVAKGALAVQK